MFGSVVSSGVVDFQNGIALGGAARTISAIFTRVPPADLVGTPNGYAPAVDVEIADGGACERDLAAA